MLLGPSQPRQDRTAGVFEGRPQLIPSFQGAHEHCVSSPARWEGGPSGPFLLAARRRPRSSELAGSGRGGSPAGLLAVLDMATEWQLRGDAGTRVAAPAGARGPCSRCRPGQARSEIKTRRLERRLEPRRQNLLRCEGRTAEELETRVVQGHGLLVWALGVTFRFCGSRLVRGGLGRVLPGPRVACTGPRGRPPGGEALWACPQLTVATRLTGPFTNPEPRALPRGGSHPALGPEARQCEPTSGPSCPTPALPTPARGPAVGGNSGPEAALPQ